MLADYNEVYNGRLISLTSLRGLTNLNYSDILELTGIRGVYPKLSLGRKRPKVSGYYPNIKFALQYKGIEIRINIDIANRLIDNGFVHCRDMSTGAGTKILLSQIQHATSHNINALTGRAMAAEGFFGYIVWGRLGYLMDPFSEARLMTLLRETSELETNPPGFLFSQNIFELLSTRDGKRFWMKNGFTWSAIFDLTPNSESLSRFNRYLLDKNL